MPDSRSPFHSPFSVPHVVAEKRSRARCVRPLQRKRRDRRVLRAGAGQVANGHFSFADAAHGLLGYHLAQLRDRGAAVHQAGIQRVVQFPQHTRLLRAIAHITRRSQRGRRDFILVLSVRAHRRDVQARMQVRDFDQRCAAWRRGDRDVRFGERRVDITRDIALHAQRGAHLRCELLRLVRITRPYAHMFHTAHQHQRSQLQTRLLARAQHRHSRRARPGQPARRYSPGGSRAHRRQITVVEQHRFSQTRLRRQHQHQPIQTR
ncbi:hypothetical protein KCU90_g606, partial [Aureobasidium melanogenum]